MSYRNIQCVCQLCQKEIQHRFEIDLVPDIDSEFILFCPECNTEQKFKYKETKKIISERKRIHEEEQLKNEIKSLASRYGFKCSFIYQSVTITTSCGSWRFDYHKKIKHLMHESTYKYNLKTGNESFWHHQFDKKMSIEEIFKYIDNHDKSALKRKNKVKNKKS